MQQFDSFYRDAELWLVELSNNGPPNMESYGSIVQELDVLVSRQENLCLPESSASQNGTDPGPSIAPAAGLLAPAPRCLIAAQEADTPNIQQSRAHGQETVPLTVLGPRVPEVTKGFPVSVILPPRCISTPYRPSTASAQKIHGIITTLNDHANSLEFIGQLGEAQRTRHLVVWSTIPLFVLLEFVQATKAPTEKAIKLLTNVHATLESLALDVTAQLRDISDLARAMRRCLMEWGDLTERKIEAALSRQEESSVERGLKYLKRTCENWRTSLQMVGGALLLASIIQGSLGNEAQKAVMSAGSLAWATANAVSAAGEVTQIRDKEVENCHGRIQDFAFPSMESFVCDFRDMFKKVDPKKQGWPEEVSSGLIRLANEANSICQVLTTWGVRRGIDSTATT